MATANATSEVKTSPAPKSLAPQVYVNPSREERESKAAIGKRWCDEFNSYLDRRIDLVAANRGGFVVVTPGRQEDAEWAKLAFLEFVARAKPADGVRFGSGILGSIWVDLKLSGRATRVALSPGPILGGKTWEILFIAQDDGDDDDDADEATDVEDETERTVVVDNQPRGRDVCIVTLPDP